MKAIKKCIALSFITCLSLIFTVNAGELKVGDMAPNFELQATNGETYKLSDFKNKQAVVLAWFPKANTKGCTIECYSLAKNGDKIRQFDVFYGMISVDPIEKNRDFVEKTKADFPMISDPTKATATAYGVLNQKGLANRVTFYIDKQGKIAKIDQKVKPAKAAEDMLANLAKLGVAKR